MVIFSSGVHKSGGRNGCGGKGGTSFVQCQVVTSLDMILLHVNLFPPCVCKSLSHKCTSVSLCCMLPGHD